MRQQVTRRELERAPIAIAVELGITYCIPQGTLRSHRREARGGSAAPRKRAIRTLQPGHLSPTPTQRHLEHRANRTHRAEHSLLLRPSLLLLPPLRSGPPPGPRTPTPVPGSRSPPAAAPGPGLSDSAARRGAARSRLRPAHLHARCFSLSLLLSLKCWFVWLVFKCLPSHRSAPSQTTSLPNSPNRHAASLPSRVLKAQRSPEEFPRHRQRSRLRPQRTAHHTPNTHTYTYAAPAAASQDAPAPGAAPPPRYGSSKPFKSRPTARLPGPHRRPGPAGAAAPRGTAPAPPAAPNFPAGPGPAPPYLRGAGLSPAGGSGLPRRG